MARDSIILLRDVEATFIPQGGVAVVPDGTWLVMQQALGGSFTLMTERGQLVRIDGQDADALGAQYVAEAQATAAARAATLEGPFDDQKIWTALKDVFDPEIPASIVELGLVYSVASEPVEGGHRVLVHMTLTAPGLRGGAGAGGRRAARLPVGAGREAGRRRAGLRPALGAVADERGGPAAARDVVGGRAAAWHNAAMPPADPRSTAPAQLVPRVGGLRPARPPRRGGATGTCASSWWPGCWRAASPPWRR